MPGYGELMRSLNQFARARGVHFFYGGYGASYGITYQLGPLYEAQPYYGEVFKNREWYPDGPTYECMGFARAKKGVNPRIQGSCRANDELNKLKAEEVRKFVEAVEPGVVFIHHEDFGGIQETQAAWLAAVRAVQETVAQRFPGGAGRRRRRSGPRVLGAG